MVECHYRAPVGADATLVAWFHVRLYRSGKIWIRAFCENGYLDQGDRHQDLCAHGYDRRRRCVQRRDPHALREHPLGYRRLGSAATRRSRPEHNVAQLISTRLVPNYWKRGPSAATLNGLGQSYTPMSVVGWTPKRGGYRFSERHRAPAAVGRALLRERRSRVPIGQSWLRRARSGTYPIVWRDSGNNLPTQPSLRPTYTFEGPGGGGFRWARRGRKLVGPRSPRERRLPRLSHHR
jgi:hypothetical protein